MKTIFPQHRARLLAAGLAFGALLVFAAPTAARAADEKNKDESGFAEKMERWQDKMSDSFRDTWRKLWGDDQGGAMSDKSIATASVDLREQKDSYLLRLNLPNRDLDKVEITLDGETLHILAPAGENAGRYEQTVALAGVAADTKPEIERTPEDNLIVVTVPKSGSDAVAKADSEPVVPDPALLPLTEWDRQIFSRMERMSREMDRVFDDAFGEFSLEPTFKGFFDEPRFGSAVDLQDEGDAYVVRAYLPDRQMKNVNVKLEDRTLRIEAKEQDSEKRESEKGVLQSTRKAAYSQILTLPGPVQNDEMKVDRKEGMLVVTLPKKK